MHDLVIRGGTVVDGTGAAPFAADVAVQGDRIVAVGKIADRGVEEIDAKGLLVTPGFVDIHTHYDAQASWSERLISSSINGVTTALIGNCGVGFAPCRPERREMLVKLMEGVEDLPEVVLTEGLPWSWESFPDYMNFLGSRRYDTDIAAMVTHAPLRVHVMGERAEAHAEATEANAWRWRGWQRKVWPQALWGFQRPAHWRTARWMGGTSRRSARRRRSWKPWRVSCGRMAAVGCR